MANQVSGGGWRSSASMTPAEVQTLTDKQQLPAPIGEIHVYLYSLKPGDAQVQMRLPDPAKPGSPNASSRRAEIQQAIVRELATAMDLTA